MTGLDPAWQPHFFYRPHFVAGTVQQSFDVLVRPGALFYTECRDDTGYPGCIGPSVTFDARNGDAQVSASGQAIGSVPCGEWVHVEISCPLGKGAPRTYSVTLTTPGQDPVQTNDLAWTGDEFHALQWLGFVSTATTDAVFYVDDMEVQPTE
ncbi:MAG: hypothetical protein AUJ96_20025 [Armatimonadetes bacterium CG2_30_66_41]|nr:MAG: hypothetical protein AUJ96_20025 [Armatimonadetes bacterium CG2_30_66_41]PIU93596.1 MAG: hypothetical protein COS65_11970 [Armatimonadetes bacterium CG06_land_8_20_14_3_00_66_21]PJB68222.1 MAG: hypothetical protein CO096_14960 [Armatimonadetes bacterium CG_4_9_14_3_um_filter_66_14]